MSDDDRPPPRRRRGTSQQAAANSMFPRSVSTYVGRAVEVARAVELAANTAVHVVYGVGGIGKSEFVLRVVEALRAQPSWREARAVMVRALPGAMLAEVAAALVAPWARPRAKAALATAGAMPVDDELVRLVVELERQPTVVFVDDLHHLAAGDAARLIAGLSRYLRTARVFVTSQVELPHDADGAPPAVTRLGPLGRAETEALVARLAAQLDLEPARCVDVFERTGGSPLLVLRQLAHGGDLAGSSLDASIAAMPTPWRVTLAALALARQRLGTGEVRRLAGDAAVHELGRRFLVDPAREQLWVHDLVRDACLRAGTRHERAAAHRWLAELYAARTEGEAGPTPLDRVELVHHLTASGDVEDAWEVCAAAYRTLSAHGVDHLLLDDLHEIAHAASPQTVADVHLLIVRILVRRSNIAAAAELLETITPTHPVARVRWHLLQGEVAQRRGRMAAAEVAFRTAASEANDRAEAVLARTQLADVATMRGRSAEAREILHDLRARHAPLGTREQARWGWSCALSYLFEERFAAAWGQTDAARASLVEGGHDDLEVLLAMLEVLARAECDDLLGAAEVGARVLAASHNVNELRGHVLGLYRGVVAGQRGEVGQALPLLDQAWRYLRAHADHVLASIAGKYLAQICVLAGDAPRALDVATDSMRVAADAELASFVAHGRVTVAEALWACGRDEDARAAAGVVARSPHANTRSRALAAALRAQIAAFEGDLAEAREHLRGVVLEDDPEAPAGPQAASRAAHAAAVALAHGTVELIAGDSVVAAGHLADAVDHFDRVGRGGALARASSLYALARVAQGHRGPDVARAVERAAEVATRLAIVRDVPLIVLARAALTQQPVASLVRGLVFAQESPEGRLLRAAMGVCAPAPGTRALLAALGLVRGQQYRATGRDATWQVSEAELDRLREHHALVVEPARAVIAARREGVLLIDRGRPLACELLAALIEAQGHAVPAEQLFLSVWGGREYHPLRHRNTLYVAIKRLRTTLGHLLGDAGEGVIETGPTGWRIATTIDALAIRPADPDPAPTPDRGSP